MGTVVDGVNASQNTARESEKVINDMADAAMESGETSHRIYDASKVQLASFDELQAGLDRLLSTFKESSGKVETTATIGDDLYDVTERMTEMLSDFNFVRETQQKSSESEKRQHPRIPNNLRVLVSRDGQQFEAVSRDLSMTGVQLRAKHPFEKHERLELEIFLPFPQLDDYANQTPMKVKGQVAWTRKTSSHDLCGIQLEPLEADQRQKLTTCFDYFNKSPQFSATG